MPHCRTVVPQLAVPNLPEKTPGHQLSCLLYEDAPGAPPPPGPATGAAHSAAGPGPR
jgi:hypothetical protein